MCIYIDILVVMAPLGWLSIIRRGGDVQCQGQVINPVVFQIGNRSQIFPTPASGTTTHGNLDKQKPHNCVGLVLQDLGLGSQTLEIKLAHSVRLMFYVPKF